MVLGTGELLKEKKESADNLKTIDNHYNEDVPRIEDVCNIL